MADPYRDELVVLRAENERLRAALRGRSAVRQRLVAAAVAELVLGGVTLFVLQALLPLLNAPSDGRFWLGALGVVAVLGLDVAVIVTIARRCAPDVGEPG